MIPGIEVVIYFLAGMAAGVWGFRELVRWLSYYKATHGNCNLCGKIGYLVLCRRCGRWVAMCCYWQVLGTDDPEPKLRRRRGTHACENCLTAQEKELLEQMIR